MRISRFPVLFACALTAGALAQTPAPPPVSEPETIEQPIERTTVNYVVAPVTALDRGGNIVNGLQASEFRLYDNGKEQNIQVDVAFQPISLVILVQANDQMEGVLKQIHHIGSLIEPLVVGDQGEAAVIAFDHRIRDVQGFTNDPQKLENAFSQIHAGSSSSRMIDAVERAVFLLRSRPQNRRRIILLISETRDKSSEGRVRETLIDAQLTNCSVYAVDVSRLATNLSSRPAPPRPDPFPPEARNLPGGLPSTPTTVQQTYGLGSRIEFVPLMVEIYKDSKGVFVDNPVEVFTKGTGGTQFGFLKQRGLEDAVQKIAAEIHSQYMLSYNPNNKTEGGFHEIQVTVSGHAGLKLRTRPGYWLASLK